MVGLTGGRVLIIDDDEDEVRDLVRALWHRQIFPLYVNPMDLNENADAFPKLSGLRLVFIDMDIVGGGASPRSQVAALANCIRTLIDPKNGPFVAVAWTKYPWLVQEFEDYAFSRDVPRPAGFVQITKAECMDGGHFNMGKVQAKVEDALESCPPLTMLQAWEHCCAAAAGEVVGELSQIAAGTAAAPAEWRRDWEMGILRLMFNCGAEYAGRKNVTGGVAAFSAFCQAMNPLVADRIEPRLPGLSSSVEAPSERLLDKSSTERCSQTASARINAMLHCSQAGLDSPFSGNVYVPSGDKCFDEAFPCLDVLLRGLLRNSPASPQAQEDMEAVRSRASAVLVEANAPCDHVQKKVLVPRLLGGALVAVDLLKDPRGTHWPAYIWRLGPLWLALPGAGAETEVALIVNSLFVTTTSFEALRSHPALFRMRSQAFAAMQTWFAGHAARPGMLLLR